eukprot:Amastigsp_a4196_5.p3 type:complete len:108 gc:universal Amastigsp_a4196_5:424-101(-)
MIASRDEPPRRLSPIRNAAWSCVFTTERTTSLCRRGVNRVMAYASTRLPSGVSSTATRIVVRVSGPACDTSGLLCETTSRWALDVAPAAPASLTATAAELALALFFW